jgi:hypothetical protein
MVMMKEFIKCPNLFKMAPTRMRRKGEINKREKQ